MNDREPPHQGYHHVLRRFLRVKCLRRKHWSFRRIGEALGVTRQRVQVIASQGWPYPRGPRPPLRCLRKGCNQPVALENLCPRHYTAHWAGDILGNDEDLKRAFHLYKV